MNINPAMIADDVMDMYLIGKRSMGIGQNKKNKDTEYNEAVLNQTKSAGVLDLVKGIDAKTIGNAAAKGIRDYALSPTTGALTTAGLFTSMYGPTWAGGPSQEDIDSGNRFSGRRALKSVGTWNTLGRAIGSLPSNTHKLINSEGKKQIIRNSLKIAPGVVGASVIGSNIMNDEDLDIAKARRHMRWAGNIGMIGEAATNIPEAYDTLTTLAAASRIHNEMTGGN